MSRIIFFSYADSHGGPATQQAHHIDFLITQGHHVILVDEKPDFTVVKIDPLLLKHLDVVCLPVWTNPTLVLREFNALLKGNEQTTLFINNPGVLVRYFRLIHRISRMEQVSVLLTLRSGMLTMTWRRYLLEWATSLFSLGLSDVVYVSRFTRKYWEKRYPWMRLCKSRVVHNGASVPLGVEPRVQPERLKAGFVGRVAAEKGPRLFCEISRAAVRLDFPVEFHMFGDGPDRESLEAAFGDSIVWHGQVTDIHSIYSEIDVLILTSPVENCPNSLLEAKSYGVPVISAPVGGIPEIVENGGDGLLTSGLGVDPFLEALITIRHNYQAYNAACLRNREKYSLNMLIGDIWMKHLEMEQSSDPFGEKDDRRNDGVCSETDSAIR